MSPACYVRNVHESCVLGNKHIWVLSTSWSVANIYECFVVCNRSFTTCRQRKGRESQVKIGKSSSGSIHRELNGCEQSVPICFTRVEEKVSKGMWFNFYSVWKLFLYFLAIWSGLYFCELNPWKHPSKYNQGVKLTLTPGESKASKTGRKSIILVLLGPFFSNSDYVNQYTVKY